MPQPVFALAPGKGRIVRFGGRSLPNGQGTMLNLDLNDWSSWFLQSISKESRQDLVLAPVTWRGKSVYLGGDFPGASLVLSMEYREVSAPLGVALAKISQAGEQWLTFDSATAVLARYQGISNRREVMVAPAVPRWAFDLTFALREQWARDLAAANLSAVNLIYAPTTAPSGAVAAGGALATGTYTLQYSYVTANGETAPSPASSNIVLTTGNQQITVTGVTLPSFATAVKWYFASGPTTGFTIQNSGSGFTLNTAGNGVSPPNSTPATPFSIAYSGSVFAEPTFTLTIPSSNAGVITSASLQNTMSQEALTVTFPGGLAPSTTYAIAIDSVAMTAKSNVGVEYDVIGSFPMLYGPAGQSNPFLCSVTGTGLISGLTLTGSWFPRWEF